MKTKLTTKVMALALGIMTLGAPVVAYAQDPIFDVKEFQRLLLCGTSPLTNAFSCQVSDSCFKNGNRRSVLVKQADVLLEMYQRALEDDDSEMATGACNKLDEIKKKVDGCIWGAGADSNDWVTDCEAQYQLWSWLDNSGALICMAQ